MLKSYSGNIILFLAAALVLRLVSLSALHLIDPTEGRYAAIGQEMLISGDWVTPQTWQLGRRVPFLAKPPLHAWLTGASMFSFGRTAAAARLPSLLSAAAVAALIIMFTRMMMGGTVMGLSVLLLVSSLLFFSIAGVCITDPILCVATTLAGVSYAFASEAAGMRRRLWGYLFFAALAIGMLVKGPVAPLLVLLALMAWNLCKAGRGSWRSLPWPSGTILFIALTLPWYAMAEAANPGFLRYFFIQENLMRYLVRDYGDLYGSAHTHPYGIIWAMLAGAFFPWSLFLIVALVRERHLVTTPLLQNKWTLYSVIWGLMPAVLFTFARQTSFYYVLPGIPWLAIAVAAAAENLMARQCTWLQPYLRWHYISAALAMVGLSSYAIISAGFMWSTVLAIAVTLMLLGAVRFWRTEDILRNPFLLAALSFMALHTAAIFSLSPYFNSTLSSRNAIQYIEDEARSPGVEAEFYRKIPNSAFFYTRAGPGRELKLNLLSAGEVPPPQVSNLVVRTRDLDEFAAEKQFSAFQLVWKSRGWTVWSRVASQAP